jgi:tripartite-type tricarboxylate transporter receptor subunit TctC
VPNGTPPAVIARLQTEIAKVMQKPDVQAQMVANGVEARWTPASEFGAMIAREGTKWHKIMRDAGIKPE